MKSGHYLVPVHKTANVSRIVPQTPLTDPLFEDYEVMNFVIRAVGSSLNISFDSHQTQMDIGVKRYFTKSGWNSYSTKLKESNVLSRIFLNKQILRVVPSRAPFISLSEVSGGYWTWQLIYYGNIYERSLKQDMGSERKLASIKVKFDLQRVPRGKGADAIKIIRASEWVTTWGGTKQ